MDSEIIKENDLIFLVLDDRRRWLVQVKSGKSFHTHRGIIEFDDIIGKPFGSCIFSKPYESQGYKFFILKPLPSDYVIYMGRKTQIIYPEDAGLILIYSGIGPGSVVIEAGCGSGALSCILANAIRPNGHVYSYDIRDKSIKKATNNIKRASLENMVTIQKGDILNVKIPYKDVDSIVLDMATPWEPIEKLKHNLKLSGTIASFSPTIEQVKKTVFALQKNEFIEVNTYELIKRRLQVKEKATRPEVRMIGHTGYVTFGRKVANEKNPFRERKPHDIEIIDLNGMPLRG